MKEKIKKFFNEGGCLLIGFWFNVAFMVYWVIYSILDASWLGCVIGLLFYLPWTLLFGMSYRYDKKERVMNAALLYVNKATVMILDELKQYQKLYGELTPEEPSEQEKSEKQNSENA